MQIINNRQDKCFHPDLKKPSLKNYLHKNPKLILREISLTKIRIQRSNNFEKFINNKLILSSKYPSNKIPSDYDMYIVGSDQIWNYKITKGFIGNYFCDFSFEKGSKKYVSYAASVGTGTLNKEQVEYIKSNLSRFDAISIREQDMVNIFQRILPDKEIFQVLDPTLLVDRSIWNGLTEKRMMPGEYIVVYQVHEVPSAIELAEHLAKELNAKILILNAWHSLNFRDNKYQTASPEDFLNYIRYAKCIVTSSFHGTVFSIVFEKPFYTVSVNENVDTRAKSILDSLSLVDRFIDKNKKPNFSNIDYRKTKKILSKLQKQSREFLNNAIYGK